MKRDVALFLVGAWVMGTISMALVATQNFYTIDRLLEALPHPVFGEIVSSLGSSSAREFLRYLSSELNRLFFVGWGVAQIGVGVVISWLLWKQDARVRWGALAMLTLALVLTLLLTPPILSVGRGLDFVPRDPAPSELTTFGMLHAAYTVLDFIKLGLGFVVAFWIHRLAATLSRK